ncbi:DNA polymerase III subunit psi [Shewanella surugensis]|uniref:DNA polymerase III subunit psi n=1 Tax=Shewanella surugensis TaxID=212020 RepID=A0ABT0LCZ4_9GAMM|nr:DNA polymerase III subunit psi [Shewanella surugensis]MCL1125202.1 DNA polymerase III subunit psi [Shewanella surugensis]
MNKMAYLDAMGITRWTIRRPKRQVFTLLIDDKVAGQVTSEHPILLTVLGLIGCPIEDCEFSDKDNSDANILWDLRSPKPEYALLRRVNQNASNKPSYLISKPLSELESDAAEKKALWQQICQLYPQALLVFGDKPDAESEMDSETDKAKNLNEI